MRIPYFDRPSLKIEGFVLFSFSSFFWENGFDFDPGTKMAANPQRLLELIGKAPEKSEVVSTLHEEYKEQSLQLPQLPERKERPISRRRAQVELNAF